jgi:hypothetical protein
MATQQSRGVKQFLIGSGVPSIPSHSNMYIGPSNEESNQSIPEIFQPTPNQSRKNTDATRFTKENSVLSVMAQ